MMILLRVGSVLSGQLVSRLGRYKIITLVGAAVLTAGMFLLSRMGLDTGRGEAVRNMIIVGFGLGRSYAVGGVGHTRTALSSGASGSRAAKCCSFCHSDGLARRRNRKSCKQLSISSSTSTPFWQFVSL